MYNKKKLTVFFSLLICVFASAQDVNIILKEASNLEKGLKEPAALEKYKQAASIDSGNISALVKCTELSCNIGARQTDKNTKANYYNAAKTYAQKALALDSNNTDANYAMAVASSKMAEIEPEKKQTTTYIRETKIYADKALAINPNNVKANYLEGKWHYEIVTAPWIKKTTEKTLYGGLPKGNIDSAIFYMEKCRKLDQYFARNYLDLAKAYQYKNQPTNALEVLHKLVKLPNRTPDDLSIKEEGQKLLDQMM